jgi:hypothetical protein
MVREEITVRNPAVEMFLLPTHKKLPGHWSIPEQEQLLEALAQDPISLGFCDYTLVATRAPDGSPVLRALAPLARSPEPRGGHWWSTAKGGKIAS